ncbi:response regulator [Arenibaculum pallidiluteum]|uniref:response regulator n=1 Tax=Arenibaculum pallidiluteum TaxID=2812559 RepID=UPI001A960995|nr:response regulator [Arenibaculum pallidiluteum]
MRFLVIEDDKQVCELLCQMVEDLGHEVCGVAHAVRQAQALIETTQPDALVVDVDLGKGGSGVDIAVQAYVQRGLRSLFVSGNLDGWVVREVQAIRPYGLIAKPFPPEALAETLRRIA